MNHIPTKTAELVSYLTTVHINQSVKMRHLVSLIIIMCLFSCVEKDEVSIHSESAIIGKWRLVEFTYSTGGPEMITKSTDKGPEIVFRNNLTFTSSGRPECNNGTYLYTEVDSLQNAELLLEFECSTDSSPLTTVKYAVTLINSDKIILSPLNPRCIEGCSYKYQKIIPKTD